MDENGLKIKNNFLNLKVVSNKNGEPVCTDVMKRLIDFTDDAKRCLLLKGEWYSFNDDYVNRKYREEKDGVEYEGLTTEEIKRKIKDKYYAERVFNNILSEQFGFENHDRDDDETGAGKIELMDLYKDGTMYAVKIGNSSAKLSYVVEQSISSTRMYKHHLFPDMPKVESVAVWIVLKRRTHLPDVNGKPDISSLKMIMLKNRLDAWKKKLEYWDIHR